MLKIDLHLHTSEDPRDALDYDARELIREAARLSFDAVAITLHGKVIEVEGLDEYAREQGVLFIPGIEKHIEDKEVLIHNVTPAEMRDVETFADLRALKARRGPDILVVAPHPFFRTSTCLGRHLEGHIDLFDAIEFCHLYTRFWNLNRRAVEIALAHGKPLVATSDAHALWMFGRNYTLVEAPKTVRGIFDAVRSGRVHPHSAPITPWELARKLGWFFAVHEARKLARWAWSSRSK